MRRAFRVMVEGRSMLPTLSPGDRLLAIRADRVRRGDVYVVRHRGELLVKRVVGLPGDRVSVLDGRARIAGQREVTVPGPQPDGSWVLATDEFLIQGDNHESTDLRAFGPVGPDDLVGRVLLRYWPRPARMRWRRRPEVGGAAPRSDGGTLPER